MKFLDLNPTNYTKDERWLLNEKYRGIPTDAFERDRARLLSGEPLAYIIGWISFLGTQVDLSSRPLIPRPETEYWTERALQIIHQSQREKENIRVLDIFAGSGAIGAAILHNAPMVHVDFGEIEERHLSTIKKNALRATEGDTNRFRIFKSDVWENIDGVYDIVLANPPYIPHMSPQVEASVSDYEPHEALYGGKDGLDYIEALISGAKEHLTPHGSLWCEHEHTQGDAVRALFESEGYEAATYNDHYGVPRYSIGTQKV